MGRLVFFLGLNGKWRARGWKCVKILNFWDPKLIGSRVRVKVFLVTSFEVD
jgi:hypothetical protein